MPSFYTRVALFAKKEENKELILHSLIALGVRIGGAAASFLMNIVIARYLGASESGYFFLVVTITTLLATAGRVGADQTVLRFVSIHSQAGDWGKVRGIIKTITKWTILPLIAITFLVCLFSKQISVYFFHKEALQWPLFWGALSMPFFAVYSVFSMALQGRKKVLLAVTGLKILTPVFLILLVFILSPIKSYYASIYYTIACLLSLLVVYYWWIRKLPAGNSKKFDTSLLLKSCMPLWVVAIMQQLVIWGGQFIAGIYNTPSELAQLAVARNTSVLVTFILTAVNYVSAPRFATMYNEGKMEELKRYARNTSRLMTLVALPLVLFIWFFPDLIMSLFGKDFTNGVSLLRVLAIGQFINVITGSVGYLLVMSGHEKDLRNVTIVNGILAILLALILNPIFGAFGSALSTAIAVASSNLMALGLVKKRLGFNTLSILGLK
jgi:O-antigen/teichoic acid export membrane protein